MLALILAAAGAARAQTLPLWSGFYLGADAGAGGAAVRFGPPQDLFPPDMEGFPATGFIHGWRNGLYLGFTTQDGSWIYGAEIHGTLARVDGSTACGAGWRCVTTLGALATLTGRIGYDLNSKQFYVTGGFAVAWRDHALYPPGSAGAAFSTGRDADFGWTIGAGVERAISHGISLRTDYSFMRLPPQPAGTDGMLTTAAGYHFVAISIAFRPGHAVAEQDFANRPNGGWAAVIGFRSALSGGTFAFTSPDVAENGHGATGLGREVFISTQHDNGRAIEARIGSARGAGGTAVAEAEGTSAGYDFTTRLAYGSFDLGRIVVNRPGLTLQAFAGGGWTMRRFEMAGCIELGTAPACIPPLPSDALAFTRTIVEIAPRLTAVATVPLGDRTALRAAATVLPLVLSYGQTHDWTDASSIPARFIGIGVGAELEAALSFSLSDHVDLGLGLRYQATASRARSPSGEALRFGSASLGIFAELAVTLPTDARGVGLRP